MGETRSPLWNPALRCVVSSYYFLKIFVSPFRKREKRERERERDIYVIVPASRHTASRKYLCPFPDININSTRTLAKRFLVKKFHFWKICCSVDLRKVLVRMIQRETETETATATERETEQRGRTEKTFFTNSFHILLN